MPDMRYKLIALFDDVDLCLDTANDLHVKETCGFVHIQTRNSDNGIAQWLASRIHFTIEWGKHLHHRYLFDKARMERLITQKVQQHQNLASAIKCKVTRCELFHSAIPLPPPTAEELMTMLATTEAPGRLPPLKLEELEPYTGNRSADHRSRRREHR